MASISESMDQIIYVGIGIFVLVLILSVTYQGYGTAAQTQLSQISTTLTQTATTNSVTYSTANSAANMVAPNALTITLGGTTGGISGANPLTVKITGVLVSSYATNLIVAVAGSSVVTQTYTLTNAIPATQTLNSTGNFYTINTIVLTGETALASPSITAKVTQTFLSGNGLMPWTSNYVNSITANGITLVAAGGGLGAQENFTTYSGPLPNTFGSALQLAVFALVFIAVILAVVGALRGGTGGGSSGGFLGR